MYHTECRQLIKKYLFEAMNDCSHEECKAIKEKTPYPINFLSEPSRAYFMEVLEFLETTGINYTIKNSLIANPECVMHILFRVYGSQDKKAPELLAYGTRWGVLARKIGLKKDVPSISATILLRTANKKEQTFKMKRPKLYFVQMGKEAKLKSLCIIETLRQSKIPVYHSLTKDTLATQLASAEYLKVPYILIMGQKECMENTILIREMCNRCQETVRAELVAEHIKKIF